ncbi:long-chain-fatty-acid--CoA ligase [Alloalcanivorax mobilis]|uniref:long-chain-fatty-acid--CoA ligase n=1 Tax=Alloalcanivorax mobilis TaxID=2019569 RepID=UPI000C7928D6|nr:long-chain-fatty-acid--CoA ligase [Alloalcanivorax mobilis]
MQFELTHALHRLEQQNSGATAVIFRDRQRTWADLAERVARLAGALHRLGLKAGERVGMLGLNSDYYIEYMLGVWWAGGALNPVNTRWSQAEVAFSLDDCGTGILLVDERFASWGDALREQSKALHTVIYVGDGEAPKGLLHYEALLRDAVPAEDARRSGDDLAGVFYTGGTTGFPKGVMLSHLNLLSNALGYLLELPYSDDDVVLGVAPIFHQAGMCIIVRALLRGCPMVVVDEFEPVAVMRAIEEHRATFTLLVPTMVQRLVDHPEAGRYDLGSLSRVLYGASPISEGVLERAFKVLPKVRFYQGYGMTETGGPYTILPAWCHGSEGQKAGMLRSAGRAMWGIEVRVVGENGDPVPSGTVGEIVTRGPGVMQGYWGREDETRTALRDGWMHSGDVAYIDDRGFLFIVDRLKDMIVSGGENVYSSEVENALCQHPAVQSCAVIGIPSEKWGEAVHAVVVLQPAQEVTEAELRVFCKTLIAGYKCPVSTEFRDSLPVSGAGKIMKHVLREPYWADSSRSIA